MAQEKSGKKGKEKVEEREGEKVEVEVEETDLLAVYVHESENKCVSSSSSEEDEENDTDEHNSPSGEKALMLYVGEDVGGGGDSEQTSEGDDVSGEEIIAERQKELALVPYAVWEQGKFAFRLSVACIAPGAIAASVLGPIFGAGDKILKQMYWVVPASFDVGLLIAYFPIFNEGLNVKWEHAEGTKIALLMWLKSMLNFSALIQLYGGLSGIGAEFEPNRMSTWQYCSMVLGPAFLLSLVLASLLFAKEMKTYWQDVVFSATKKFYGWLPNSVTGFIEKIFPALKFLGIGALIEAVLFNLGDVVYSLFKEDPSQKDEKDAQGIIGLLSTLLMAVLMTAYYKGWAPMKRSWADFFANAFSIAAAFHVPGSALFYFIVKRASLAQLIISQLITLGAAGIIGVIGTLLFKNNPNRKKIEAFIGDWLVIPPFLVMVIFSVIDMLKLNSEFSGEWIGKLLSVVLGTTVPLSGLALLHGISMEKRIKASVEELRIQYSIGENHYPDNDRELLVNSEPSLYGSIVSDKNAKQMTEQDIEAGVGSSGVQSADEQPSSSWSHFKDFVKSSCCFWASSNEVRRVPTEFSMQYHSLPKTAPEKIKKGEVKEQGLFSGMRSCFG